MAQERGNGEGSEGSGSTAAGGGERSTGQAARHGEKRAAGGAQESKRGPGVGDGRAPPRLRADSWIERKAQAGP